jgi:hypothetical protein
MNQRSRHLWLLGLAALAVRGPLLLLSPGAAFDMESYARVAGIDAAGLYSAAETAGRYPYLPLWWLCLKALAGLQAAFGGDFGVWARLPGVAGDVAISALAYLIVERRSRSHAAMLGGAQGLQGARLGLLAGLSWALNPLAVLVSTAHGQFDSVALALLLAAAWWLEYSSHRRSELFAGLCVAAAIAFKTWPLAFLPLYLGVFASRREMARFAALALLPSALLLLPFVALSGLDPVLARLSYSGATALGLSGALRASFFAVDAPVQLYRQVDDLWRVISLTLLGLGWLWTLWQARRLRLLDSLAWVALSLVLLAPGLSPQYLVWPAAFLLLLPGSVAWRYSAAALGLLAAFYALYMPPVHAGSAAWDPPALGPALILLWAAINLACWAWGLGLWAKLQRQNLTPRRGSIFR